MIAIQLLDLLKKRGKSARSTSRSKTTFQTDFPTCKRRRATVDISPIECRVVPARRKGLGGNPQRESFDKHALHRRFDDDRSDQKEWRVSEMKDASERTLAVSHCLSENSFQYGVRLYAIAEQRSGELLPLTRPGLTSESEGDAQALQCLSTTVREQISRLSNPVDCQACSEADSPL